MKKITRLKFIGQSKKFNANQKYTISQIAERTGLPLYKLQDRLKNSFVFDDNDIKSAQVIRSSFTHFKSRAHEKSAQWLRKALV